MHTLYSAIAVPEVREALISMFGTNRADAEDGEDRLANTLLDLLGDVEMAWAEQHLFCFSRGVIMIVLPEHVQEYADMTTVSIHGLNYVAYIGHLEDAADELGRGGEDTADRRTA